MAKYWKTNLANWSHWLRRGKKLTLVTCQMSKGKQNRILSHRKKWNDCDIIFLPFPLLLWKLFWSSGSDLDWSFYEPSLGCMLCAILCMLDWFLYSVFVLYLCWIMYLCWFGVFVQHLRMLNFVPMLNSVPMLTWCFCKSIFVVYVGRTHWLLRVCHLRACWLFSLIVPKVRVKAW